MTREEARRIIATWLVSSGYIDGWFDEEDVEALRMAIEALQAQPTHGRLIDADALGKDLMKRWDINDDQDFCNKEVWDALRNAPTVQADRPHGEWVRRDNYKVMGEGYIWHCSICDEKVYQDSSRDYPSDNFCPNCGADMRKEKAEGRVIE